MDTNIAANVDGYYVEIYMEGVRIDECGPFDSIEDAQWAEERAIAIGGGL